jgi:hypothetical protein
MDTVLAFIWDFATREAINCIPAGHQMLPHIVTPYDIAMEAVRRIPNGEVRSYECTHFEPYLEPDFDTVVTDQIDFPQTPPLTRGREISQPTRIPSASEPRTADRGQRLPPQAGRQPQTWHRPERAVALGVAADEV